MKLYKDYGYTKRQLEKLNLGLCVEPYCMSVRALHRHRCHCCESRFNAKRYPERYCYKTLKMNAKRRGKFFDLTFEQFVFFINKYNYLELKGKTAMSLTVDCIINKVGYTEKNIRGITLRDNVWKRHYVDYPRKPYNHEEAKQKAGTPF